MNGLKPMAILSPVDSDLIANYCALYSQVVRCQHKINETEGFIETAGGSVKSHPAVDQFTALSSRMLAMGKCLGLSPLARVKLVADPQVQEKNWLSEICGVDDKEADE
jgi:P27 family predicted phage terminase small subunit